MKSFRPVATLGLLSTCLVMGAAPGAGQEGRQAPKGVRFVYLIRHGEYDHEDKADSRTGKGLVALGHEQARLAGRRLASLGLKVDTLVSSEYTRARETADDIGQLIMRTPVRDDLLNECTPASIPGAEEPSPEPSSRCDANLEAAWARYMRPSPDHDAHDVLVCHGNVIRWFVSRSLGVGGRYWRGMAIGNASITVIAVRADGSTRLASFSDVGHIPPDRQTWTGDGAGWAPRPPSP